MKIYLVGGAVRDKYLGLPVQDKDWVVVGAKPQDLLSFGYHRVGKDFPVFLHPVTKEEYALARKERKTAPGYTGFTCEFSPDVTLEEDLKRRDLTINAMAETESGELIDPFHGLDDLNHKILRHVSEAFIEDPLRVLRVARFFARFAHLGFSIAPETLDLMKKIGAQNELTTLSKERIWQETQRALTEQQPWQFFQTLQTCSVWQTLNIVFNPIAFSDLEKVSSITENPITRFAALFLSSDYDDKTPALFLAPKEYQQLAQHIIQHQTTYQNLDQQSPLQILTLFKQLRALQQPEKLTAFIQLCSMKYGSAAGEKLTQILEACKTIDPRQYLLRGLQGADLGAALEEAQLKIIKQY